jgi:hypothetical protein
MNLAFGLISVAGFLLYPLCSALLVGRIDKYDILAIGIALGQIFRVVSIKNNYIASY